MWASFSVTIDFEHVYAFDRLDNNSLEILKFSVPRSCSLDLNSRQVHYFDDDLAGTIDVDRPKLRRHSSSCGRIDFIRIIDFVRCRKPFAVPDV